MLGGGERIPARTTGSLVIAFGKGGWPSGRWARRLGIAVAVGALVVIVAAGVYAVGDAILSPAPIARSPGFVETVLASRAVVASIRIAVIFAAAFIVISVVALVAKRQWPTRIGPVQFADQVSGLDEENEQLRKSLENARDEVYCLRLDLAGSNLLLDQFMEAE
jgi:hypothetical protein